MPAELKSVELHKAHSPVVLGIGIVVELRQEGVLHPRQP